MRDDLTILAADYHEFRRRTRPTNAHLEGDYRFADRFEDVSVAAEDEEIAEGRDFGRRAAAIAPDDLSADQRITREMMVWDADARADLLEARLEEFSADPVHGIQSFLQVAAPKFTLPTPEVAEKMLSKYAGIAQYFRDSAKRHHDGVANGRTPAQFAVEQTVEQISGMLEAPVAEDPLLQVGPTTGIDRDAWLKRLSGVVEEDVRPAMAGYRDALRDHVLPHARPNDHAGLTWVSGGDEAYRAALRFYTTLPLTARQIHDIGLEQIESLAAEYRALGPEVTGKTELRAIMEALRDDPSLHHQRSEDVVIASKAAMAKARSAMGDWFGILPRADCDVEATPAGALAFYFPPAKDGSRGGVFFMNTSVPSDWGRYQIEATSFHEGIPGHHLQMAIASELQGIPEFRKYDYLPAYGEGWGLYTERLADEMGLYSSTLDRIGMLCADSMRACRLVVDTGMHALGWGRQQAIDYMVQNSPMTVGQVTREVDRYVTSPGQAVAYMIGRLEIQRIRRAAEERLGERFDIKAFHDRVLGYGSMPLPVLERHVGDWVESAAA